MCDVPPQPQKRHKNEHLKKEQIEDANDFVEENARRKPRASFFSDNIFPETMFVVKWLTRKDPEWYSENARRAFEKESNNFESKGVWSWDSVEE